MLFEQEINRVGYLSRSVPDREHLVEAILALKKEKNAIILAHYYVSEDIQKIADHIGDSYALAKISKESPIKQTIFKMAMEIGAEWANQKSKFYGYDHHIEERSQLSVISIKIASGISLIFSANSFLVINGSEP